MPQSPVTRNGKTYDAGDVSIGLLGYEESEVVDLNYSYEEEHALNFTLPRRATSYSIGKEQPKASITLMLTAVRRLEKIAKASGGDSKLSRLKPFPITVTLFNDDQEEFTDIIYAKFKGQGRSISGTEGLRQQFELFVTDIEFGAI